MRNKILALALVLALVCSAVHASGGAFDLSVGLGCSSKEGFKPDLSRFPSILDWKDLEFGLEVRTKLSIFELDMAGKLGTTEDKRLSFSGLMLGGISEDFLPFLRLGFCLGPQITFQHDGKRSYLVIDGNPIEGSSLKDALEKSRFHFRGTIDFLLGEVIKLGLSVTVPTGFHLESRDLNLIVPSKENLKDISYALVLQMRLV